MLSENMILVTGASGFVGKHVVAALAAKSLPVRALYNNNPPSGKLKSLQGVEWVQGDLLDIYDVESVVSGSTTIIHCAAMVTFQRDEHERMLHFNQESTANLVNEALDAGVGRFIYISSIAALGKPEVPGKEITEEEQWGENKFSSVYGVSKYLAEIEVWRGIGEGLNAVVLNPGVILGDGNWETGSSSIIKLAAKEFKYYTKGVTAWVDVEDLVSLIVRLLEAPIEAERFIVHGGNYAYKSVFELMARYLNKKPPTIYASSFMTGAIWRLGKLLSYFGKKPVITRETSVNAHDISYYSNAKLLKQFPDFQFRPIEVTVENMVKSFLARTS